MLAAVCVASLVGLFAGFLFGWLSGIRFHQAYCLSRNLFKPEVVLWGQKPARAWYKNPNRQPPSES